MSQVQDRTTSAEDHDDPIFKAVNFHKKASQRFAQAVRAEDELNGCTGAPSAEFDEAETASRAATVLLLNTVPTSLPGILTLLAYIADTEDDNDSLFGLRLYGGAVTEPGPAFRLISDALQSLEPDDLRRYADEKDGANSRPVSLPSKEFRVLTPSIAKAMERVDDLVRQ
jgi:hypothetical protein